MGEYYYFCFQYWIIEITVKRFLNTGAWAPFLATSYWKIIYTHFCFLLHVYYQIYAETYIFRRNGKHFSNTVASPPFWCTSTRKFLNSTPFPSLTIRQRKPSTGISEKILPKTSREKSKFQIHFEYQDGTNRVEILKKFLILLFLYLIMKNWGSEMNF